MFPLQHATLDHRRFHAGADDRLLERILHPLAPDQQAHRRSFRPTDDADGLVHRFCRPVPSSSALRMTSPASSPACSAGATWQRTNDHEFALHHGHSGADALEYSLEILRDDGCRCRLDIDRVRVAQCTHQTMGCAVIELVRIECGFVHVFAFENRPDLSQLPLALGG